MNKNDILLECSRLDSLSVDQLYILLAGVSEDESFGLVDKDEIKRLINRGRNKLQMHLSELRALLCGNKDFHEILKDEKNLSRAEIAAAIIDIGISQIGLMPVSVVSLLIAKDFLKNLCHEQPPTSRI